MKSFYYTLLLSLAIPASNAFTVMVPSSMQRSVLFMSSVEPTEQEEGEGEGLDLDLGEMFEMFDAADKNANFDDALKKVKGSK
ncbi:hypothetical protein ACA910_011293 [Epithemia clementina (nom. ined.)]